MSGLKKIAQKLNNVYLLSFLLPFFLTLGIFITRGIWPFGDRSFMYSDMYHQYVPFLTGFWDKLHAGESLSYSFQIGLGTNYISIYAYYLASPIYWLSYFVGRDFLADFMGYVILIKTAVCGLTFCYYLSRRFDKKDIRMVWFSVFYAMSGFMAAYNWNHMWLDCLFLLPLIILGLEELIQKGRCRRYILTLFFSIFTNYYISVILCIFLVLYFTLQLFTNGLSLKEKGKAILRFAGSSLLAGGLAGFLLVPVAYSMLGTGYIGGSFPGKIEVYFDFLSMIARHVPLLATERGLDHWPNIYCGLPVLILIPMWFFCKKISLKRKVGYFLLLAVFFLSFSVNVVNYVWHGMNYPNSLPARNSFLYIFVILTMCYEVVEHEKECGKIAKILGMVCAMAVLALSGIFVTTDGLTVQVMACAWIFLAGYFIFKVMFAFLFKEFHWEKVESYAILLLVCVEALLNMDETSIGTTVRSDYLERIYDYQELVEMVEEREGEDVLFRMDCLDATTKNDASLANYASISIFSSTTNSNVKEFYDRMGLASSKVNYHHQGATPFVESFLSMKYLVLKQEEEDTALYQKVGHAGEYVLYENQMAIPLGFVLDGETRDSLEEIVKDGSTTAITTQNKMGYVLNAKENMFSIVFNEEQKEADNTVLVEAAEDGYLYAAFLENPEGEITLTTDTYEREIEKIMDAPIHYIGYFRKGEQFRISSDEAEDLRMKYYLVNLEVLQTVCDTLRQETLVQTAWENGMLSGKVDTGRDGYLCLTIPCEGGWHAYVDGKETPIETFCDTMMLLPIRAGAHEIKIVYRMQGWQAGLLISAVSLMIFLLPYMRRLMKGKERKEETNDR